MVKIRYAASSLFLSDLAARLQPPERFAVVTGSRFYDPFGDLIIVLSDHILITGQGSRTHFAPLPAHIATVQNQLTALGMEIEAIFHSHPGVSNSATRPSPIDYRMAQNWENGGIPFIGGIFSEGGRYIRFFNHSQCSAVIIYGKHEKAEAANCFELPTICGDPLQAFSEDAAVGTNRPPGETPLVEAAEDSRCEDPDSGLGRDRQQPDEDICSRAGRPDRRDGHGSSGAIEPEPATLCCVRCGEAQGSSRSEEPATVRRIPHTIARLLHVVRRVGKGSPPTEI